MSIQSAMFYTRPLLKTHLLRVETVVYVDPISHPYLGKYLRTFHAALHNHVSNFKNEHLLLFRQYRQSSTFETKTKCLFAPQKSIPTPE